MALDLLSQLHLRFLQRHHAHLHALYFSLASVKISEKQHITNQTALCLIKWLEMPRPKHQKQGACLQLGVFLSEVVPLQLDFRHRIPVLPKLGFKARELRLEHLVFRLHELQLLLQMRQDLHR